MQTKVTAALSLVPLGLVVSALMVAWFKDGMKAFNPAVAYKQWPIESKRLFISGFLLYAVISVIDVILMLTSG